ncbi:hypothetical protein GA0070609_2432 [Micromonospora echinaurantiaca]|uniref:Uncharacterized protein n=1 Tax=Micromonospora echinaurantiaca TaxID=47857 RepID=A0A1C5HXW8_9ACTN|nr:hypothetical protein GA0070609_2432 [Micromonospora echinaurantiaca]
MRPRAVQDDDDRVPGKSTGSGQVFLRSSWAGCSAGPVAAVAGVRGVCRGRCRRFPWAGRLRWLRRVVCRRVVGPVVGGLRFVRPVAGGWVVAVGVWPALTGSGRSGLIPAPVTAGHTLAVVQLRPPLTATGCASGPAVRSGGPTLSWSSSARAVTVGGPSSSWSGSARLVAAGLVVVQSARLVAAGEPSSGAGPLSALFRGPGPFVPPVPGPVRSSRPAWFGGWLVGSGVSAGATLSERLIPLSHQYAAEVSRSFLREPTGTRAPDGIPTGWDGTSADDPDIPRVRLRGRVGPVVVSPMWRYRPVRDGPISATRSRSPRPARRPGWWFDPLGGVFVGLWV